MPLFIRLHHISHLRNKTLASAGSTLSCQEFIKCLMCTPCRTACMHFTWFHCQTMPSPPFFWRVLTDIVFPCVPPSCFVAVAHCLALSIPFGAPGPFRLSISSKNHGDNFSFSHWIFEPLNTSNDLQRIFTPKRFKTYCGIFETIPHVFHHGFLKPVSVFARTCLKYGNKIVISTTST